MTRLALLTSTLLLVLPVQAQTVDPITASQNLVNATIQQNTNHGTTSQAINNAFQTLYPIFRNICPNFDVSGNCLIPANQTVGSIITLATVPPLDLNYAGVPNPTVIKITAGDQISFCPALSCLRTPSDSATPTPSFFDHQRTSALFSASTQDDGHSEEQTLAVATTIGTGYHKPYAASTAYSVGDNTAVGNAVYRAVQAGTTGANSAPPGTRPTAAQGGSYTATDGTVRWQWVNDSAIDAKVGAYIETNVVNGAGAAWGAAFNYHVKATPQAGMFLPGVEFDYSNDSGTPCVIGVADCTAVRIALGGSQITEGVQITGALSGAPSSFWALRINGDMVASQSAIEVDAATPIGLGFGSSGLGGASHSVATIQDTTTSPAAYAIGGAHSIASIYDNSTSQNGISLNGTYAGSQIVGNGFAIAPDGGIVGKAYYTGTISNPVQGVTCSAGITSSFAVTNGIVTHC